MIGESVGISSLRMRGGVFLLMAVTVVLGSRALVSSEPFLRHVDLLAAAVVLDFVLVLPVAYYLLLVRAGAPALSVIPVLLVGALLAANVLPQGHALTSALGLLALSAELVLVGVLIHKTRAMVRAYRAHRGTAETERPASSFADAFPHAVRATLGSHRVLELLATEIIILYFALASWRQRPEVPEGAGVLTSHRDVGWGGVFVALSIVVAVEIAVVHLLVSLWSPLAAWILTGLGVYGLLWLVGDYRALHLRPSFLTARSLHLRIGMRWEATIPLSAIRAVRRHSPGDEEEGVPAFVVAGGAKWVLELRHPVEARGLLGARRSVSRLAVAFDGSGFEREIDARREALE